MSDSRANVAGYFRVSKARDGMSAPDLYRHEIERYCKYKRLRLGEVFSDIDFSGRRDARARPGLEELLGRRREFHAVIAPKLARFGRSVRNLVEMFDLFDRDGIALVFLDMNIDTSTSQGRLLRHIMAAFAEYESDVKSDYCRANRRLSALKGHAWGKPAYGYEKDSKQRTFFLNEQEAKIVVELFTGYVSGRSMTSMSVALNRRGVGTKEGGLWRPQAIARLIDRPVYAGLIRSGDDLVRGNWQPIIDRALWERALARRRAAKLSPELPAPHRGTHLLSGLLVCGACGRNLYHRPQQKTISGLYRCSASMHGGSCPGGGLDANRAEQSVVRAFLDRAWFAFVPDSEQPTRQVINAKASWDQATLEERRKLLAMAITRIVLPPRPRGRHTHKGQPRSRDIRIEWVDGWKGPRGDGLTFAIPEPIRGARKAGVARRNKKERGEATRRYYEEWRRFQERLRAESDLVKPR